MTERRDLFSHPARLALFLRSFGPVAAVLTLCACERPVEVVDKEHSVVVGWPNSAPAPAKLIHVESEIGDSIASRLRQREHADPNISTDDPSALVEEFPDAPRNRKAEIIAALGASGDPDAWMLLSSIASGDDIELRLAALDAMAMHEAEDPSDVIQACLESPDVETRALAATLLGRRARDPQVWARAAVDPSSEVRIAYHAAVESAPQHLRLASARAALASGDPQLRMEAAAVLGGVRSKAAIEELIPLLDDPAASNAAADSLFYLLGRPFDSAAEAQSWWRREQGGISGSFSP